MDEVAQFSELGDRYGDALARGLSVTGESAEYFARGRLARVREIARKLGVDVRGVLDFGCGTGSSFALQREMFPGARLVGFEPAEGLRAIAATAARSSNAEVVGGEGPKGVTIPKDVTVDLVYCNGVFHHIPVADRALAAASVRAALRPGGLACIWENSPFNPGTRYVMSRVEFDRDAILLRPRELSDLLRTAGLTPQGVEFHFIFPSALRVARPLEPMLRGFPFGGQYVVTARRG